MIHSNRLSVSTSRWYRRAPAICLAVTVMGHVFVLTACKTEDRTTSASAIHAATSDCDPRSLIARGDQLLAGNGSGGDIDEAGAAKLYQQAAAAGDPIGKCRLADSLLNGRGVPIDPTRAVRLYQEAADAGVPEASYSLGQCYADGRGVPQDTAAARQAWTKAAESGYAPAQFKVGTGLMAGHTGPGAPPAPPQDAAAAARWFERAARQGHVGAQANIARAYAKGEGVDRNAAEAYYWSSLALAGGVRETGGMGAMILTKLHGQVEKELSPDQLAAVKQRVADFRATPETARP